jgi:hypothetical protein
MYSILQNFKEYKTYNEMFHSPFQVWNFLKMLHIYIFFLLIYKLFQNSSNLYKPFKQSLASTYTNGFKIQK